MLADLRTHEPSLMGLKLMLWPPDLFFVEHHAADVVGRPLAETSTVPWTAAWRIILVLFLLPTSRLFSFSLHLPILLSHAPPPPPTQPSPLIFLISLRSPLDTILTPLCFHLFLSCITPLLYFIRRPPLSFHLIILCTSMPRQLLLFFST